MTVMLTQDRAASFPDRPSAGGTGLRVEFLPGCDGSYLGYNIEGDHDVVHSRFMFRACPSSGSQVTLLEFCGDDGDGISRIIYQPDQCRLVCRSRRDGEISYAISAHLHWQSIELKADKPGRSLSLYINGLSCGEIALSESFSPIRSVRLGGLYKDQSASGEYHLDEWVIRGDYIGPVVVPPSSDYADDPSRWIVLYNRDNADSVAWVQYYRDARIVPYANLVGLSLPVDEVITPVAYASLATLVSDYLSMNRLSCQVMGILLGYGVPGYVNVSGRLEAIGSLLHRDHTGIGPYVNSNAGRVDGDRPDYASLVGDRLTSRIDGPDLSSAIALIDRATDVTAMSCSLTGSSRLYIDPFAGDTSLYRPITSEIISWYRGISCMSLRLPVVVSGDLSSYANADFDDIESDGFLWSLSCDADPSTTYFGVSGGARIITVQLHLASSGASTLRASGRSNWIDSPLCSGYAAAAASSREYSASAVPRPGPFFNALRRGWTLGEAWYLSLPVLREGMYLVGDPLMTAVFPREGWNIYGPLSCLDQKRSASPSLILPCEARELLIGDDLRPAEGKPVYYEVCRMDSDGQSLSPASHIHCVFEGGSVHRPPLMPAWPDRSGWRVRTYGNEVEFIVLWSEQISEAGIRVIELIGRGIDGSEWQVGSHVTDAHSHYVKLSSVLPSIEACYCWRITGESGVTRTTPWSSPVYPAAGHEHSLTLMEVDS